MAKSLQREWSFDIKCSSLVRKKTQNPKNNDMMSEESFRKLLEKHPAGVPKLTRSNVKAAARCFMRDDYDLVVGMFMAFFPELADHYINTTGGIDEEYEKIFEDNQNK